MLEGQASNIKIIYVRLLNEGADVVRPVDAIEMSSNVYKILESNKYDQEDEEWEFTPGTIVRCEEEKREGDILVAKEKVK